MTTNKIESSTEITSFDTSSLADTEAAICKTQSSDNNKIPLWRLEEQENERELRGRGEKLTKVKSAGISICTLLHCVLASGIGICTVILIIYLGGGFSSSADEELNDLQQPAGYPKEIPNFNPTQTPIAKVPAVPYPLHHTADPINDTLVTPIPMTLSPTIRNPVPKLTSAASIHVYSMLRKYMDDDLRVTQQWTTQGKAFRDLVLAEEVAPVQRSYSVAQRYALMNLYYSTKPASWESQSGWDEFVFTNECSFFGVKTCRRSARGVEVIKLDLCKSGII